MQKAKDWLPLRQFARFCREHGKDVDLTFDNEFSEYEGEPVTMIHEKKLKVFRSATSAFNWLKRKHSGLFTKWRNSQ